MQTAFTRRNATTLKEQEREFTNEGAPPPGTVGTDLPALHVEGNDEVPAGEAAPVIVPQSESVASLRHRVRVAEEERDSLATFTQEEPYLRACSRVDALERRLEEQMMKSADRETSDRP